VLSKLSPLYKYKSWWKQIGCLPCCKDVYPPYRYKKWREKQGAKQVIYYSCHKHIDLLIKKTEVCQTQNKLSPLVQSFISSL
jgi:hypothetical protein